MGKNGALKNLIRRNLVTDKEAMARAVEEKQDCEFRATVCTMPDGCLWCGAYRPKKTKQEN